MRFALILLAVVLLLAVVCDAKDGKRRGKKRKDKDEVKKDKEGKHNKKAGRGKDGDSFQHAKLSSHLLKRYRKMNVEGAGIPVTNTTETLKVKFGVALIYILDVDESSDIVTFTLWERYAWDDAFLSWDPADYDGIGNVRLPIDELYKPDMVLFNSVAPQETMFNAQAVVSSTGSVLYISPTVTKLRCSRTTDGKTLTCMLKYGSWVYDGFQLDPDFYNGLEQVDVSDFVMGNIYTLESNTAEKHMKYYPCCAEPYPDLTFNLVFKKVE